MINAGAWMRDRHPAGSAQPSATIARAASAPRRTASFSASAKPVPGGLA
jgi:hypothetical protein